MGCTTSRLRLPRPKKAKATVVPQCVIEQHFKTKKQAPQLTGNSGGLISSQEQSDESLLVKEAASLHQNVTKDETPKLHICNLTLGDIPSPITTDESTLVEEATAINHTLSNVAANMPEQDGPELGNDTYEILQKYSKCASGMQIRELPPIRKAPKRFQKMNSSANTPKPSHKKLAKKATNKHHASNAVADMSQQDNPLVQLGIYTPEEAREYWEMCKVLFPDMLLNITELLKKKEPLEEIRKRRMRIHANKELEIAPILQHEVFAILNGRFEIKRRILYLRKRASKYKQLADEEIFQEKYQEKKGMIKELKKELRYSLRLMFSLTLEVTLCHNKANFYFSLADEEQFREKCNFMEPEIIPEETEEELLAYENDF